MPHNPTVQEHVRRIALERDIPLSEARRAFIEEIDYRKRLRLSQKHLMPNRVSKGKPENPMRRLVEPSAPSEPLISAPHRVHYSDPNPVWDENPIYEPDKPPVPPSDHSRMPTPGVKTDAPSAIVLSQRSTKCKTPIPGSNSSIIVGELRDPEKDFNAAYRSLRGMTQFSHLPDQSLRQRMREVAWRYDIPINRANLDAPATLSVPTTEEESDDQQG